MSFCIGHSVCRKCGKPLTLFEGWICLECEKAEQEPCEDSNANQHNSNALNDVIQHTNALEGDAISRQAVNEIINDIRDCISVEGYCAILERLKKLPSVNSQESIAQERYEDLCEYFGKTKDILKNRDDFKAWLGRVKWHIRKAEELYEKYEQEPKTGRWIDDKCSVCGKGTENLIDSPEWYRNEEPNFCPFCGLKLVKSQAESEDI